MTRIGQCHNLTDLVAALDEERRYRLELRRGHETTWWNNILLLAGDHYAQWDPTLSRVSGVAPRMQAERTPGRVRIVLNHALTVARTEQAKLTKNRPIMQAMPASDNADDIAAARVGNKVLDALEYKFKLRALRKKATRWTVSTGVSAVGVFWDPQSTNDGYAEYVVNPETGQAVWDPEEAKSILELYKQGAIKEEPVERQPLGDLDLKLYSAFQLLPDPSVSEWADVKELITIDVVHLDKAASLWPGKVSDVGQDDVMMGTMERRALFRSGLRGLKDQRVRDCIYVYSWWCEPGLYRHNSFLKDGFLVRWTKTNSVLDHVPEFPFTDKNGRGELPFSFFEHIPSEVSIWPETVIQHIRGPNLEMDKTASQLIENKDYLCNPMWRRAAQHRMKGQVKNVPGAEVVYHHVPNVPPPEPVPGIPLPPQVENILVYLRDQILDISGQGETSRGRVPSGVRAGVMIEYLQEEDETRLATTTENLEDFVAKMARLCLQRVQQFYTEERILKYSNEDAQLESFRFKGADLGENTDVICQPGSAFPKMKAAKQQFVLELVQLGIETDPKRVRDLLELGGAQPDEIDLARAQARRENTKLVTGDFEVPPDPTTGQEPMGPDGQPLDTIAPKFWHNDEVHLAEHYNFMSTAEYEEMVLQDPSIDQRLGKHAAMHELQKLMKLQQQMMMTESAKGAPGESSSDYAEPSGSGADPDSEIPEGR